MMAVMRMTAVVSSEGEVPAVLGPSFSLSSHNSSPHTETYVRALEGLLRLCFSRDLSAEELHLMLGYNVSVPPYVRLGLFSRLSAVEEHRASIPHVPVQLMADAGHAVFWDDAARFNERLHAFYEAL